MKAGRPRKPSKVLNINLELGVAEKLEQYLKETGQAKTTAIERMLTRELEAYFVQEEGKRVPR